MTQIIQPGIGTAAAVGSNVITDAMVNSAAAIAMSKLALPVWTAYTPTWTATGTAPDIGNSTVLARYFQIGKLVIAHGRITFGNTATFGTLSYSFALPVAASFSVGYVAGNGLFYDNSANNAATPNVIVASGTTMNFEYGATYLGTDSGIGATSPWTWAVSDIIEWTLAYEAS
jgi:hypothetical protein